MRIMLPCSAAREGRGRGAGNGDGGEGKKEGSSEVRVDFWFA